MSGGLLSWEPPRQMMQTGSSNVRRWKLKEPGKGTSEERLGGLMSKWTRRVLSVP